MFQIGEERVCFSYCLILHTGNQTSYREGRAEAQGRNLETGIEAEAWRKTGCWLAPNVHIQCSFLHHPGPHALPYQPSMRKMFPETCPLVRTTCRGGLDHSISIINEEDAPADLPTGQCGGIFSVEVPLSLTTHLSLCQVGKKLSITQLQFYLCLKVTP